MIALPLDLEQQVIQFAQIEHLVPVSFLKRVIADYRSTRNEIENNKAPVRACYYIKLQISEI